MSPLNERNKMQRDEQEQGVVKLIVKIKYIIEKQY